MRKTFFNGTGKNFDKLIILWEETFRKKLYFTHFSGIPTYICIIITTQDILKKLYYYSNSPRTFINAKF